jgi:hypothetical protein
MLVNRSKHRSVSAIVTPLSVLQWVRFYDAGMPTSLFTEMESQLCTWLTDAVSEPTLLQHEARLIHSNWAGVCTSFKEESILAHT